MNRTLLSTAILCALPSVAFANSQTTNYGPSLTTGPSSNHLSVYNATHNPGLTALTVNPEEQWRMSYLFTFHDQI